MALFSRRPNDDAADAGEPVIDADPTLTDLHADVTAVADAEQADAERVPHVGISVSTFGAPVAAPPTRRGPATAPVRTETVAGMPDNTLLAETLAALPEKPDAEGILSVMRQAMQGQLYVRVLGDAREQIAAGTPLRLAITSRGDERFLLVYSGAAALRAGILADPETKTSALGQLAQAVLQGAVDGGYAGIVLDHAGPRRLVLPTALISKTLEESDTAFTLKNLLSDARTDATPRYVVEALLKTPFWVAAGRTGEQDAFGLAEARTPEGKRYLQIFSHPLEVLALGRQDRPVPLTAEQLGRAISSDPTVTGVLLDPAGPWIQLQRPQLKPLIALAPDAA